MSVNSKALPFKSYKYFSKVCPHNLIPMAGNGADIVPMSVNCKKKISRDFN